MEVENAGEQLQPAQSPEQNPPVVNPPSHKPGNLLIPTGVVIAILVVGFGAYYLGTQRNQSITQPQQIISKPTTTPSVAQASPTSSPTSDSNLKSYTHPTANYSFSYPSNWKLEFQQPVAGLENDLQLDLTIKSPDYALTTEGIEYLEKGVEVVIYRSKTNETSIDNKFETDRFAGQIASSKTSTTVNGQKAIQYDYSYESTQATDIIFIKNGVYYLVKLKYADMQAKNQNSPLYSNLLKSFKAP